MSEEKAPYTEQPREGEQEYQIRDEAPHDYFCQIPNLVEELNLTPHAYRLYGHLRRVAGESGKCWQNTTTLAKSCNMSTGKISEAKQELEGTYPPLIRIVSESKDGRVYHVITVTDIWGMNHDHFTGKPVHLLNGVARSQCEHPRSQCETKNITVKKNPIPDDLQEIKDEANRKVDGILAMAQSPGMRKLARENAILSSIGEALHINTETKRWHEFAKFVDARQQEGESLAVFLSWLMGQKNFNISYWSPQRMREMWPQAFVAPKEEDKWEVL